MRKLLLILLLIPFFTDAQTWQQNNLEYGHQFKGLKALRAFLLPLAETTAGQGRDTGAIYYRLADSSLYVYTGSQWRQVAGSGGGAVTSVFSRTGAVAALEADYNAFYPLLSGTYNNPSWLNQLAWSKITGTPTTLAGYGITDAQGALTLTTTGSSGAATLVGNTLNIPEYAAGASGLNTVMGIDSTTTHNLVSTKAVWGDSLQFNRATIRNGLITGDSIIVQTDSVYLYGNSITAGTGASPAGLRFAALLCENLKTVEINGGVGGSILKDWFTTTLPTVPNNRTGIRYVVLMYGTNEARQGLDPTDHRDSLEIAIDSLVIGRGYPLNKIVIATAPVMGTDAGTGTDLEDVRLMAAAAKQAGLNKGTQVIDVFNYMIAHGSTADYLSSDSIHPNNTGHYAISEAITYGVNTGNAKFNGSIFTKRDIKSWGNAYIGGAKISVGTNSFADQTSTSDHIFKATTGTGYWGYNSVTNPYFYISSSAGNYFRILPTTGSGAQMGTVGSTALEIQSNSVTRQRWDASGNETNTIGTLTRTSTGMTNTLSGNSSWNFSNANSLFSITNTTATQLLRVEIRNTATSGNNNGSLHLEASGSSPTLFRAKQGDFIIKAFSSDEKRHLLLGAGNGTADTVSIAVIPGGKSVFGDTTEANGALVTMNSTTLGFMPPRMTGAQAEAIVSPAEGLMVYATDGSGSTITSKGWWGYDGAAWVKLNYLLFGLCFVRRKKNYFKRT